MAALQRQVDPQHAGRGRAQAPTDSKRLTERSSLLVTVGAPRRLNISRWPRLLSDQQRAFQETALAGLCQPVSCTAIPGCENLGINPDLQPGKTRSQRARQSDTAVLVAEGSVDTRCPVKC